MKTLLIIYILLSVELAFAGNYPVYYERVEPKAYSLIILCDSTSATYLSRITRDDGTTWFYYDIQAVWGYHLKIDGESPKPYLWIKNSKFRFDYFKGKSNLVEIDKMGPQGKYVQIKNMSE